MATSFFVRLQKLQSYKGVTAVTRVTTVTGVTGVLRCYAVTAVTLLRRYSGMIISIYYYIGTLRGIALIYRLIL